MLLNICIWMNIPSHYQSAFFRALAAREDVDLMVVYLYGVSNERAAEGWGETHEYQSFERSAEGVDPVLNIEALLPDWIERSHIICGYFASGVIDLFCREGVKWSHWSEMPGIRLAELLGYRTPLFRLLNPMMLVAKRSEGRRIRDYALGAFGQGLLARQAFRRMGLPDGKIAGLYYAPAALEGLSPSEKVREFASGRKVFLAVGALCRRKGIDVLLKAFSRFKTDDWCLVLCGLDRAEGEYERLSRKLGLDSRVLFLGAYPSDRIAEVYAAADVFVLASRFDGWGAVLNEAASIGMPLIGTDLCGASWHLVKDGVTGYRVRAASVRSLARAMNRYIESPERIAEHGREAKDLFLSTFTPEANAERLVEVLRGWVDL